MGVNTPPDERDSSTTGSSEHGNTHGASDVTDQSPIGSPACNESFSAVPTAEYPASPSASPKNGIVPVEGEPFYNAADNTYYYYDSSGGWWYYDFDLNDYVKCDETEEQADTQSGTAAETCLSSGIESDSSRNDRFSGSLEGPGIEEHRVEGADECVAVGTAACKGAGAESSSESSAESSAERSAESSAERSAESSSGSSSGCASSIPPSSITDNRKQTVKFSHAISSTADEPSQSYLSSESSDENIDHSYRRTNPSPVETLPETHEPERSNRGVGSPRPASSAGPVSLESPPGISSPSITQVSQGDRTDSMDSLGSHADEGYLRLKREAEKAEKKRLKRRLRKRGIDVSSSDSSSDSSTFPSDSDSETLSAREKLRNHTSMALERLVTKSTQGVRVAGSSGQHSQGDSRSGGFGGLSRRMTLGYTSYKGRPSLGAGIAELAAEREERISADGGYRPAVDENLSKLLTSLKLQRIQTAAREAQEHTPNPDYYGTTNLKTLVKNVSSIAPPYVTPVDTSDDDDEMSIRKTCADGLGDLFSTPFSVKRKGTLGLTLGHLAPEESTGSRSGTKSAAGLESLAESRRRSSGLTGGQRYSVRFGDTLFRDPQSQLQLTEVLNKTGKKNTPNRSSVS